MKITKDDYFKHCRPANSQHEQSAEILLERVNRFLSMAAADGVETPINPKTGNKISGTLYGGYRPADCKTGAPASSHKTGQGVDILDPKGNLGFYANKYQDLLKEVDLYIEHPASTRGWVHFTTRAPKSKNRVFYP